jgi:hypothetical protein
MNDHPDTIESLKLRVDALEQRVNRLEASSAPHPGLVELPIVIQPAQPSVSLPESQPSSGVLRVLGKAMLGIAGAYVLRALAESTSLPRLFIAVIAIAYALAWLVFAARSAADAKLPRLLYAATSALILAPMLWELSLRFHVVSADFSAAVLALYAATATLLTGKRELPPIFPVAYFAAAVTALALSIATHVMLPYLALLLLMFAVSEQRSLKHRELPLRVLLSALIACALWILVFLYRTPLAARSDYPDVPAALLVLPATLFFVLFAASLGIRTVQRRESLSAFESVQAMIAFFLAFATWGYLVSGFYPLAAGSFCLVLAAACYAVAWGIFRRASLLRNFRILALWSAALLLIGIFLSFSANWKLTAILIAATAAAFLADRLCCITLQCHAAVYLLVAAAVSGSLQYSAAALAGSMPPTVTLGAIAFAACSLFCYLAVQRNRRQAGRLQSVLVFAAAMLAAFAVAALLAFAAARLAAILFPLDLSRTALVRTFALCLIALALAYFGARQQRSELTRIAYLTLALLAIKLLLEDMPRGHMELIALSIAMFAFTLIAVPRLAHIPRIP